MRINVLKNAKRNIIAGFINKFIVMLFPFIVRTIINMYLGSEYLGLNSLFGSILGVLSLSELGFGTAVVYHMYKPIADNDTPLVCALLNFYKKAYIGVGCVITAIGLLLIPFLPNLIEGSYPESIDLVSIYLVYLSNTVLSYFLSAYLNSILVVYQRNDVTSTINTIITIGLNSLQLVVIIFTRKYFWYCFLLPISTIINNIWVKLYVKKNYPQYRCCGKLDKEHIQSIKKLIAGAFIQKATGVTRNALDSICTSAFLGLSLTAIYNNYYTILNAITVFLSLVYNAVLGGIGNHIATKSSDDNFAEMKKLDFVYLWASGWCTACLLCLYQPFMELWMGSEMILPMPAVLLFCLYFYLLKLGDIRCIYTDANGLWWEHKYRSVVEFLLNIVLNVFLGKVFGIYGIILATVITLLICNYLWGSIITFRCYFGKEARNEYYRYQAKYTIVTIVICAVTYLLCLIVKFDSSIINLIVKAGVCTIVPNLLYLLIYRKNKEFHYIESLLKTKIFIGKR